MTVEELIDILRSYPPSLRVAYIDNDEATFDILVDRHYDAVLIDPAAGEPDDEFLVRHVVAVREFGQSIGTLL